MRKRVASTRLDATSIRASSATMKRRSRKVCGSVSLVRSPTTPRDAGSFAAAPKRIAFSLVPPSTACASGILIFHGVRLGCSLRLRAFRRWMRDSVIPRLDSRASASARSNAAAGMIMAPAATGTSSSARSSIFFAISAPSHSREGLSRSVHSFGAAELVVFQQSFFAALHIHIP